MRYTLEFFDEEMKVCVTDPIVSSQAIMTPNVGDTLEWLDYGRYRVVSRNAYYTPTTQKIQVVLRALR